MIKDYSPEETEIRKTVLQSCGKKVFLCDSSKFGQCSPFRVCSLNEVDTVITDSPFPFGMKNTEVFTMTKKNEVCIYLRTEQ